jgi:outer membrane protein OmpA-like peptidoglycan-associated protein
MDRIQTIGSGIEHRVGLAMVMLAMLGACANPGSSGPAIRAAPTPTAAAAPAAPQPAAAVAAPSIAAAPAAAEQNFVAPAPVPFENSIARAGAQLLADARSRLGNESRSLVIDPLIDANTGAQTVSTVKMGEQLESIVKAQHANWRVEPLTRQALNDKPLLLIGTLTPVNIERSVNAVPDAFRVWLTVIDLRTGRVVAKQLDRSTIDSVNPEPLKFYSDSPTWHKDKTVLGYINSCQVNTKIGDPADPEYLAMLPAAAVVNEAIMAYSAGRVPAANLLYKEAATLAEPGDLRVLNGLYLTSWQLGQRDSARDAFSKLVASGLDLKRVPMKFLFQPGGTSFNAVGDLPQQYQIWVGALAQEIAKAQSCVRIVGHTSRTGSASVNERLSRQRAETIQRMLDRSNRALGTRLSASGVGSREALVGLGTDDQRDALDRRVEFRVVDCV